MTTTDTPAENGQLATLPPDQAENQLYSALTRALDSGKTAEELGKFMDFIERLERLNAEKAFNAAMSACQLEMPVVVREDMNKHLNTRYAKLERVASAIKPVYTRHGFSLSFDTYPAKKDNHIGILCYCQHKGGFTKEFRGEYALDGGGLKGNTNKTEIQAEGSTETYGRRYTTLRIFNITIADEDDDGNGYSPPLNATQIAEINTTIGEIEKATGKEYPFKKFLEYFGGPGCESLDQIRQAKFSNIMADLNARRRKAQGVQT